MFPEQLKKILNLIKKTGDKVVIFDASEPDNSYVVMDFNRYETMIGEKTEETNTASLSEKTELSPVNSDLNTKSENLTEEDLTDKINREISIWKNSKNAPSLAEEDKPKKVWSIPPQIKDKAQEIE